MRELDNALERADHPERGTDPDARRFPARALIVEADGDAPGDNLRAAVRDYERHHIQRVLRECGDDKREAARGWGWGCRRSTGSSRSSASGSRDRNRSEGSPSEATAWSLSKGIP